MTRKERAILIEAIRLIHGDEADGYKLGMDKLARLAGLDTSASGLIDSVLPVSLYQLASRPNCSFEAIVKKTK